MANAPYDARVAETGIDTSIFSPTEKLTFERITAFYGSPVASDIFNEYAASQKDQRDLSVAMRRVLARRDFLDSDSFTDLLKQRFSSVDDVEIVFDEPLPA